MDHDGRGKADSQDERPGGEVPHSYPVAVPDAQGLGVRRTGSLPAIEMIDRKEGKS